MDQHKKGTMSPPNRPQKVVHMLIPQTISKGAPFFLEMVTVLKEKPFIHHGYSQELLITNASAKAKFRHTKSINAEHCDSINH